MYLWREGMSINFTLFFEDPFWIGLLVISDIDFTSYSRIVFGGEPTEIELYSYLKTHFNSLEFITNSTVIPERRTIRNPKRRQREISKTVKDRTGTKKSYDVIKNIEQQGKKKERQLKNRRELTERQNYIVEIKKKKEKHKGH
jgi:hypothetical protein